ncbi:hypothetical protein ACFWJM_11910 [Streptomyces sp. NPDC127077]|uniref:hypothetical protein n=1 Tax=Streptomyces sp. NPDC127077 TaxID=3347131 RepID=UPI0036680252
MLAFVGIGLRPGCDSPVLAVLTQMRVRLATAPAVVGADRLPPVVGELLPAVRAHRPPRLPLRSFPLLAAPLLFAGGLAAAGEVGVPAGIADRLQQRLGAETIRDAEMARDP